MSSFFSGIKVRYSLLLIIITIVVYAGTSIIPSNITGMMASYQSVSLDQENQLKYLPKKEINRSSFIQFKRKNNKKYSNPQEEIFRSLVFRKNRDFINAHNSNINRTYNMALNSYADLIPSQFSQIYLATYKSNEIIQNLSQIIASQSSTGLLRYQDASSIKSQIQNSINQSINTDTNYDTIDMQVLNKASLSKNYQTLNQRMNKTINSINLKNAYYINYSIDWTVHAGKVRYQGICGACYTFATSDVLSSLYSINKLGFFVTLSTQQVIDCSKNLTYGCNGGFLQGSYAYMQVKGIQTEHNYPYTSASTGQASTCKKDGGNFKISSFKNIKEADCKGVLNQLNFGPVSIGIAGYRLQFYQTGIFNDCNNYIDHAVVLISYKGGVGWKIKNSWGSDWGMNGFAWIADGNNCGICNMAVAAKL